MTMMFRIKYKFKLDIFDKVTQSLSHIILFGNCVDKDYLMCIYKASITCTEVRPTQTPCLLQFIV